MLLLILERALGFLTTPFGVLSVVLMILILAGLWTLHRPGYLPPGPPGYPFIGNMLDMADNAHLSLTAHSKQYGDMFSIKLGTLDIVMLNSIGVVKEALVKKQDAFADRPSFFTGDIFSEGRRNISNGEYNPTWKCLRKYAHQGIRHFAKPDQVERYIHEETFPQIREFIENKDGRPFDPKPLVMLMVANVICGMCFGTKYSLEDPELLYILKLIKELTAATGNGFAADFAPVLQYVPSPAIRNFKRICQEWVMFIQDKVDEHRKDFKPAALDQTRHAIDWAIVYLVHFPDVQAKVHQEIDEQIGVDSLPKICDKDRLPFCQAVIMELMRVRTVVPLSLPLKTTCATTLGGFELPKGTVVWPNLWALHMDEREWDKPEEFHPERFLNDEGNLKPKPESYLPFSAGRRGCLGEALVKDELFLMFTCLLQQFVFTVPPGAEKPSLVPYCEAFNLRCQKYEVIGRKRNK
uniref:Cytochrome P450 1A1-like n=1 Tax=Saccoglossus kowalevskii TaxID=10224 RepID=A0ABM0MSB7_SACKO|nr:PREDICTED: cytochrome P450 1A1-like [Saccoglossus kowalevskii]